MSKFKKEFLQRIRHIPFHGIGLSVDVYTPDIFELTDQFAQHGLSYGYLEVFKAEQRAIEEVRARLPSPYLEYHADGLWVTQPDWMVTYPYERALQTAMSHLRSMGCFWINQECATKQIGGHSFGTYLPPLLMESSASMTARNVEYAQAYLDAHVRGDASYAPLFLLETPPLSYFVLGQIGYAEFFRLIADRCACGFVLDIGHVWTVYRYTGACEHQTLEQFLEEFLNGFPLERVVQIHIAGLDCHPAVPYEVRGHASFPNWIDAHDAPIPSVSFNMLEQVLSHPRLVHVKGLAMEVDTKEIALIVEEFARLRRTCGPWEEQQHGEQKLTRAGHFHVKPLAHATHSSVHQKDMYLEQHYQHYVAFVTFRSQGDDSVSDLNALQATKEVGSYRDYYLPHEISVWGGQLQDMFPNTFRALEELEFDCKQFMTYWYSHPQRFCESYDFFLLKIHYFVEYIREVHPQAVLFAAQEAADLRNSYAMACQLN
ncbi:MAG: hypothetical protein NPIRA02_07970 [Nitrospirales bacterium]|nr:MAG: hypothetical protein NPIRA02_07970 [Nitrospirales bacterium]